MKKQTLINALERVKIQDGTMRAVFPLIYLNAKDYTEEQEAYTALSDAIDDLPDYEQAYEIAFQALGFIAGDYDETPLDECEFMNVYTWERLQVLNVNNQQEIAEIVKEYGTDVQTACAIWYDEAVRQVVNALLPLIDNHDNQ